MNAVVDRIEAGWRGETGSAYRALHRAAAEDTVRIREILVVLEEAVRMSRDGFTQQELDTLQAFSTRNSRRSTNAPRRRLSWDGQAREAFIDELDRWDREMQDL
ncbi:WXG100 family type VII secretion target [Streptomyces sp. NPDC048269]|uniref:WXG100 family type VII secretion target n=1 Tax=Streptomyces sp. NPDC048269 TaxID=3155753 RepID=UPI0034497A04